jgi:hypothetical protein
MTKSRKFVLCFAAAGACSIFNAGTAFATQGLSPNFNSGGQTGQQLNCVAAFTNQWIHNGSVVRGQDRQTEVRNMQNSCAHD